ncbi:MAG TPA: DNA polymerase III subunit delta' [Ktedonobacterales bacterium]|nr:DNA polymerase III subunit delta' [Ktedonobacterales bacterium]
MNPASVAYNQGMWNIIGHRQLLGFFEHAQRSQHLSHAYLLAGPAQVGKRTLALAFAQAMLCTAEDASPPGSPCGVCAGCVKVQNGSHPDLSVVQPEAGKKTLSIDTIRSLLRAAALQPQEGSYNIFILPNAELMTLEAANALLKTLEEPAPHTILLLTTVDEQLLPKTIASRCQVLLVSLVNAHDMQAALMERWDVDEARAQELSTLAAGRPGWAITASQNQELEEERASWFQMMATLCESGPTQRIKLAAKLIHDTERLDDLLAVWLIWWRELLLSSEGYKLPGSQESAQRERYARQIQPAEARAAIERLQEALRQLEENANPRFVLENLLLALPTFQAGAETPRHW